MSRVSLGVSDLMLLFSQKKKRLEAFAVEFQFIIPHFTNMTTAI